MQNQYECLEVAMLEVSRCQVFLRSSSTGTPAGAFLSTLSLFFVVIAAQLAEDGGLPNASILRRFASSLWHYGDVQSSHECRAGLTATA